MSVLGIVPVKSSSQKNSWSLGGCSLLQRTVETAVRSRLNDVVVLGDGPVQTTVRSELVESAPIDSFLCSYLSRLQSQPSYFMLLQCTSPLRSVTDIDNAISMLPAEFIVSVTKTIAPYRCLDRDGGPLYGWEQLAKPRQEHQPFYQVNGSIYLRETASFLRSGKLFGPRPKLLVIEEERSLDVDEYWQLRGII